MRARSDASADRVPDMGLLPHACVARGRQGLRQAGEVEDRLSHEAALRAGSLEQCIDSALGRTGEAVTEWGANDPRAWWRHVLRSIIGIRRKDFSAAREYMEFVGAHRAEH